MNSFPQWTPCWLLGLFNTRVYWLLQTDYYLCHIFQKQKVAHDGADATAHLADVFLKLPRPLTLKGWLYTLAAPQCPSTTHSPRNDDHTHIHSKQTAPSHSPDSSLCCWKIVHLCLVKRFYLIGREVITFNRNQGFQMKIQFLKPQFLLFSITFTYVLCGKGSQNRCSF